MLRSEASMSSIRSFHHLVAALLPAHHWGFSLLILLLELISGPAYAEWVALGDSDSGTTIYVDTNTLQPNGTHINMWVLYDFKTMHTATGGSFFSSKAHTEYDCTAVRQRMLAYTRFSGHMGNGKVVSGESDYGGWTTIAPKSVGQILWRFACSKE